MLGPFATASRRTPHCHSPGVSACASMSTTTTTTRDRGDRYGPMEWAQQVEPMENELNAVDLTTSILDLNSFYRATLC